MKHLLHNTDFPLDEILFNGRNKEYGAYALRHDANRILIKATFAGITLFTLIAISPFVIKSLSTKAPVIETGIPTEYTLHNLPIEKDPEPEIQKVSPKINTVNTQVPEPKNKPFKETPPATIKESENAVRGTDEIKGDPPINQNLPPTFVPKTEGNTGSTTNTDDKPKDDNTVKLKVDVEADFPGGINVFRNKVIQNFDPTNFEDSGEKLATTITFIVEKDGTISGIKSDGKDVSFNKQAEQTIKKVKGKWTPAKIKGEPVRSYFRFPISMNFE